MDNDNDLIPVIINSVIGLALWLLAGVLFMAALLE